MTEKELINSFKSSIADVKQNKTRISEIREENGKSHDRIREFASKLFDETKPFEGVVFNRFSTAMYQTKFTFYTNSPKFNTDKLKIIETLLEGFNEPSDADDPAKTLGIGLQSDLQQGTRVGKTSEFTKLRVFKRNANFEISLDLNPYSLTNVSCIRVFRDLQIWSDRYGFKIDSHCVLNSLIEAMIRLDSSPPKKDQTNQTRKCMEQKIKDLPILLSLLLLSGVCTDFDIPDDEHILQIMDKVKEDDSK